MITITITPEIEKEIQQSISKFEIMIAKENLISSDLRYHKKISIWSNQIIELKKSLVNGYI